MKVSRICQTFSQTVDAVTYMYIIYLTYISEQKSLNQRNIKPPSRLCVWSLPAGVKISGNSE